ncbi:MAG: hypothetical protein IPP34_18290 [Bacteroidetes bacterium]|nr:hypothetical protein [Bacteroidota bacterium]
MIRLVPFLWILLLKAIDRPIGRNSFIHGSGSTSDGGYSGSDSDGYDSHGYDSGGGADSGGGGDGGD